MAQPVSVSKGFVDVDHSIAWLARASGIANLKERR
jgi:hypothetical protein